MGSHYLGAYWGARAETLEQCTDRCVSFLKRIGSVDPALGTWYQKGRSRRDALRKPVEPTPVRIRDLLLAGRNRRDLGDRPVVEELGFRVGMWNGSASPDSVGLSVHCGCYTAVKGLGNALVLNLPSPEGEVGRRLFTGATAGALVEAVVESWEPTWATWTSHELADTQPTDGGVVGWMTYLSDPLIHRLKVPLDGYDTKRLGGGLLITLGEHPTAVSADGVLGLRAALGLTVRWRDQD